jgi:fatty acid desaturase
LDIQILTDITTEELPLIKEPKEELKPVSFYAQHLRGVLPANIFEPVRLRLLWCAGYLAVMAGSMTLIATFETLMPEAAWYMAWPMKAMLGMVIGVCAGALGFFAHEVLHGSVVRNRKLQDLLGFVGFMPWFISPTFWRFWHNQLHHGKTQAIITDPDAFPTLKIFKHSKFMNFMFPFTPGSGHKRSYLYFFFWFSFHVLVAQSYLRFRNSVFEKLNHRRVTTEMLIQLGIWTAILAVVGFSNIVWTFLIPLAIQNYFAMSYIATNHNLNPLTRVNDPLVNSLTVTNNPVFEFIALNFGYHVEHHIFPTINGFHAKKIHALLKREFPNQFMHMPKWRAVRALYKTARIYKNHTTLVNPETGQTYATLSKELTH